MATRSFNLSLRRHRVYLCTQNDVVVNDGELQLVRESIKGMWAEIINRPDEGVNSTPEGMTYGDSKITHTHRIRTRYDYRYNISNLAWIYEMRRKSSPRWFKIISVDQTEQSGTQYFMFYVRLTERSDQAAMPEEWQVAMTPERFL